MHRVTWDVKRVFLGLTKVRRKLMERWGLTPARFDMLFAIRCERQFWFPQRKLRELLGVSGWMFLNFSAQVVHHQLERLVIGRFAAMHLVGLYSVAGRVLLAIGVLAPNLLATAKPTSGQKGLPEARLPVNDGPLLTPL